MLKTPEKLKLLLLIAVFVAPVAASYFAYFFWTPKSFSNYGELLKARSLPDVTARLPDGKPFHLSQLKGKWVFLMVSGAACGNACQHNLYSMRQARLIQGREQDRVERVWLVPEAAVPNAHVIAAYPRTWVANIAPTDLPKLNLDAAADELFLIDPLGNLILRYPINADAARIAKDLKRLLSASRIG